jgi:hypothetical protein
MYNLHVVTLLVKLTRHMWSLVSIRVYGYIGSVSNNGGIRQACLTVDHISVANEGNHGQNHGLRPMASSTVRKQKASAAVATSQSGQGDSCALYTV